MKSRERSSHGRNGTGKWHSNPAIFLVSYFVCWQSKHLAIKLFTSLRIPGQVKFSLRRARVLVVPMWPPMGDEWYSVSKVGINEDSVSNQMRPPFRIKSWAILYSGYYSGWFIISCCNWRKIVFCKSWCFNSLRKVKQATERSNSLLEMNSRTLDKASAVPFNLPEQYWI